MKFFSFGCLKAEHPPTHATTPRIAITTGICLTVTLLLSITNELEALSRQLAVYQLRIKPALRTTPATHRQCLTLDRKSDYRERRALRPKRKPPPGRMATQLPCPLSYELPRRVRPQTALQERNTE